MRSKSQSKFFNSLKFKLPAPIIFGSFLLTIILFVVTYNNLTNELDKNIETNFKVFEKMFNDIKALGYTYVDPNSVAQQ